MKTREEFLQALVKALRAEFPELGRGRVAVSVGFPKGRRGGRGKAIGQCWPPELAEDKVSHVFIHPGLDLADVPHVMLHELIHDTVGCGVGHKGSFVKLCKVVGLVKPWTATTPSEALASRLNALVKKLGTYPHGRLNAPERDPSKPKSRLLLLECPCGHKLRVAASTYEAMAPVTHGEEGCELTLRD